MSLIEAVTNVVIGYLIAVAVQVGVFPLFGLALGWGENLTIGAIFTGISIARSYIVRRIFEWRALAPTAAKPAEQRSRVPCGLCQQTASGELEDTTGPAKTL